MRTTHVPTINVVCMLNVSKRKKKTDNNPGITFNVISSQTQQERRKKGNFQIFISSRLCRRWSARQQTTSNERWSEQETGTQTPKSVGVGHWKCYETSKSKFFLPHVTHSLTPCQRKYPSNLSPILHTFIECAIVVKFFFFAKCPFISTWAYTSLFPSPSTIIITSFYGHVFVWASVESVQFEIVSSLPSTDIHLLSLAVPLSFSHSRFVRIRFSYGIYVICGSSGARICKVDVNCALGDCWFSTVSTFLKYHWRIKATRIFFSSSLCCVYFTNVIVPWGQTQSIFFFYFVLCFLSYACAYRQWAISLNSLEYGRLKCHIVWLLVCIKYTI